MKSSIINPKTFFLSILVVSVLVAIYFYRQKPYTKDTYLNRYSEFIQTTCENSEVYSDDDWIEIEQEHYQFHTVWYKEFEQDLTMKEKLRILKFRTKFQYCRISP